MLSQKQVEFPLQRVFRTPKGNSLSSVLLMKDIPPSVYEKLDLGRKNLQECPFLQDRVHLKFLDLQGNFIKSVDNLYTLKNLVFLDFYNNQLEVELVSHLFIVREFTESMSLST